MVVDVVRRNDSRVVDEIVTPDEVEVNVIVGFIKEVVSEGIVCVFDSVG